MDEVNKLFADLPYKIRINGEVFALEVFGTHHKLKEPTKVITYAMDGIPVFTELFNTQCEDATLTLEQNLIQLKSELYKHNIIS